MAISNSEKPDISIVDDVAIHTQHENLEKAPQVLVIDSFRVLGLSEEEATFYNNYSPQQRSQTKRKVDIRLTPMLATLYLVAHLDRANIGNTKIEGIDKDLGISGIQWNAVLSLFFVPYILLEIPSQLLLRRFKRPSTYIGILVTCWGTVMTLHGVVNNFAGLLSLLRLLLGTFEASFFPAAAYLCTFWYMPQDLAQRISWFYFASGISGAFSGLLAAAIAQMDGIGGYEGWRWIFIIEGLLTVFLGIATFWLLIDSPELSNKWLEPNEIRFLQLQRLVKQGGRFHDETNEHKNVWADIKACLLDWKLWLITATKFLQSAMSYGTKFNLPTITRSMGFDKTRAQLMSAPPYLFGAISALVCAWMSDRFYWRMPFVAVPFSVVCVGFSIMLGFAGRLEENVAATYLAAVLTCLGIYPPMPASTAWAANNLAPASRSAVGLALSVGMGNCGGIVGSYMFFDSDAPTYRIGFGLGLGFGFAGVVFALLAEWGYWYGNKKKAQYTEEEIRAKYSHDELLKMGNKNPLFKYTL